MQADTRLIQYICNTDQTGADLCRQTYSLCFTTGQGAGRSRQCQIFQTDIQQELQTCLDLSENKLTDCKLMRCQLQPLHKLHQMADRQLCYLCNILISDRHCQSLRLQSLTAALCTRSDTHIALVLLLHTFGTTLAVTSLHILDHALECDIINTDTTLTAVLNLDNTSIGSMHEHVAYLLRQVLIRRIDVKSIGICQRIQNTSAVACRILCRLPAKHCQRTIRQTQRWIRYHQRLIKLHLHTDTVTDRTGTKRIIK